MSASFQDNREMPCVADDRKCSPPAVENTGYASGNFKDILRDIAVFILMCLNFSPKLHIKLYPFLQISQSSSHATVDKMINNPLIKSPMVICPRSVVTHQHCPRRRALILWLQTEKSSLVPCLRLAMTPAILG